MSLIKNLRFHTGQTSAYAENGINPLSEIVGYRKDKDGEKANLYVYVDNDTRRNDISFLGDAVSCKINNFYNYMYLNTADNLLRRRSSNIEDVMNGRYNYVGK